MRKTTIISFTFFFILFFLPLTPSNAAESILIKNGTIVPVVGEKIMNGSLLIQNGKIAEIGKNIRPPEGARIIDARGMFVYPGLVAPMTAIGVTGYPGAGNDTDEMGITTPQMDPYDAINPEDECIEVTRLGGVTTVQTASGSSSVINGKSIAMNLDGTLADDMVIKRYVAQIINVGARESNKYPSTLPGVMSVIREKLNQAKLAVEKEANEKKKDADKKTSPAKRNLEIEALIPVVKGEVPALFLTYDEVTIRNAIALIKEYHLKGIIQARNGILKHIQTLAEERIPVIWAGTTVIPNRWQPFDWNYHMAALLQAHGVLFAFDPGGWGLGNRQVRNLPVPASLSVAHGLSEEAAIKAMTINAARILGIDDRVGSLEKGKKANVVIWSGSPVQMRSRVLRVVINGKLIPMESVQTRLFDRFDKIVRQRMKK